MAPQRHLTVSQITHYVKNLLTADPLLQEVWVRGEISNFARPASGHMYFTLKDEQASLRAVMFRGANRRLTFQPENGLEVLAAGHISLYERGGVYQLYVSHLEPDGIGSLHAAFERLKARLEQEGLFDPQLKQPLPKFPQRVGVVTSATGAALQDIINIARRRFPSIQLVVAPAAVQGPGAAGEIARALDLLNSYGEVDVIIVGRGGGSLEDLWAFNEEETARAIHRSQIPVVSAVGHETDFTIADFTADLRAPTPSGAAELVVPNLAELQGQLEALSLRLAQSLRSRLQAGRHRLDALLSSPQLRQPLDRIATARQLTDGLEQQSRTAVLMNFERQRHRLQAAAGRLSALSPLAVLARGYSVTRRAADGKMVRRAADVNVGEEVLVALQQGELTCRVDQIQGEN